MVYLLLVSFIWAFSFGLIKGNLMGLDSNFVSWVRMSISLLIFLPFLRVNRVPLRLALKLILAGMLQYGLMYTTYIYSYRFLKAHEVALFTIFTPIYVTLLNDYFLKRFQLSNLFTTFLAVIGTGIIVYHSISQLNVVKGFVIMQISNMCFAFGQIYYREIMKALPEKKDYQIFGLLYFGAALLTALATSLSTNWSALTLTANQLLTLLYLGVMASGIGFFLWNYGARKVEGGTLAIFNNLKIPLAIAVSFIFFHEKGNIPRLIAGGIIVLIALWMNERKNRGLPILSFEKE